eukprot:TRINITY_DN111058_c0_g1_i1.p1 TRINITY_DN111058_c0_g1~~TRINITY_DN111058_c0_g1_i1.p1  ORF type:complete len:102 (-),score=32.19 TRINITY_DN111058_c0_g1_i1:37-342(-)
MSMKALKSFLFFCLVFAYQPLSTGGFLLEDDEANDDLQEETSFMQVGISKPVHARRVTGRTAVQGEEEEEEEEESAFFQSSLKKTRVNERQEEFESDEFSM